MDTFVFENDFPAVQQDQPELVVDEGKKKKNWLYALVVLPFREGNYM